MAGERQTSNSDVVTHLRDIVHELDDDTFSMVHKIKIAPLESYLYISSSNRTHEAKKISFPQYRFFVSVRLRPVCKI